MSQATTGLKDTPSIRPFDSATLHALPTHPVLPGLQTVLGRWLCEQGGSASKLSEEEKWEGGSPWRF